MKIRRTFIIRWILADEDASVQKSNIDVEYIQTGEKFRASSFEEAHEWMNRIGLKQSSSLKSSRSET
jgi:hypothetical protein